MTTSNEWIDYVESSCGPEIRAQFERALARNLRGFIDEILVQNVGIITPEKHYYGLSDRMEVVGSNYP